jgi:ABC-type sulfate/molybdate transport systems ATPase subunit
VSYRVELQARVGVLTLRVSLEGDRRPTALIGPNGAGKTTLLRLIAGAPIPHRGRITVGERVLLDSEAGLTLPPEARDVGYVPQGYGLFPHLDAAQNVAFGLGGGAEARRRAQSMLQELGVAHLAGRRPQSLSGGERQRVALARALVRRPALLLLDEPLSAMDVAARRSLRALLARRLTPPDPSAAPPCIIATHDPRDVLALNATVHVLQDGAIVQRGTAQDLRTAPATDFVAEFFATDL